MKSIYALNEYTGCFNRNYQNRPHLKAGDHVRISVSPTADAREVSDCDDLVEAAGLEPEFLHYMPRLKCDVYMLVKKE